MRGVYPRIPLSEISESLSAERNPSPGFAVAKPPSPTSAFAKASADRTGEGALSKPRYCAIDTGEKSMNQLFGCTTPVTFGLIARGPTSWAT